MPNALKSGRSLTSIDDTLTLINGIDHPRLRVAFDAYYFGWEEPAVDCLTKMIPHLAVVQLGDARHIPEGEQDRCPLGAGIIPLQKVVCSLTEAGYDGFFEIKLMGQEIETADYCELLHTSRQTMTQLVNTTV